MQSDTTNPVIGTGELPEVSLNQASETLYQSCQSELPVLNVDELMVEVEQQQQQEKSPAVVYGGLE